MCPYISEDAAFKNLQLRLFSLITSKTFLQPLKLLFKVSFFILKDSWGEL